MNYVTKNLRFYVLAFLVASLLATVRITFVAQSTTAAAASQGSYRTKAGIKEFAKEAGIAPGIVVGRLQHEKLLPSTHCNELKRYLTWNTEESTSDA
jgi:hypothetical protein